MLLPKRRSSKPCAAYSIFARRVYIDLVNQLSELGAVKIVTIHQAKTHLSKLIQESLNGEEIIIAKGSKSLIRLVPLETQPARVCGALAGLIVHMDEDFDAPLDDFKAYSH